MRAYTNWLTAGVMAGTFLLGGCHRQKAPRLPTPDEVREVYGTYPELRDVDIRGNVVELHFRQSRAELRHGGSLWAQVGPYIYLLSPATRTLFERYPGAAGVRVITTAGPDEEVARALLRRDELTDILWRRTLNILGHALQEGTKRPSLLQDLVQWGEEHTLEHHYNPDYVPE